MTVTKQIVHAEVDDLPDEDLDMVYSFIRQIKQDKQHPRSSLMQKLKQIQIDAPADFSVHHDFYASGVEDADPDVH